MPCRGCYGPAEGVEDQGAKIASAIGSLVDSQGNSERSAEIVAQIVDPVGTFYRFGMGNSMLRVKKL